MWDSSAAGSRQNVLSWRAGFLSCCDDSQKLGRSGGLYIKRNLFSLQKTEYKEKYFFNPLNPFLSFAENYS